MTETLTDTSTRVIAQRLVQVHETTAQTTGRVLTLIVMAGPDEDIDSVIGTVKDASREHPSRVLLLIDADAEEDRSRIDAEIHVGGDAGASELVVIRMFGEVAAHAAAVVTPLLLPDTPIVCWWPTTAPASPGTHPVGRIAQRRIVDSRCSGRDDALAVQLANYTPGDSDMAWARITLWRAIVASTMEQGPRAPVIGARISGPAGSSSVDLAAGWLADRLQVPVERSAHNGHGIRLVLQRADGDDVIDQRSLDTVEVHAAGRPVSLVALNERSLADCLSEELRHLDPDQAYAGALAGVHELGHRRAADAAGADAAGGDAAGADAAGADAAGTDAASGPAAQGSPAQVVRSANLDDLVAEAAGRFVDVVADLQERGAGRHGDGVARVVLTGGGAGTAVLARLAVLHHAAAAQADSFPARRIDWTRVHVFFGDERDVPLEDAESNEGQARAALLDAVGVPAEHVHGWRLGELDLDQAVAAYAEDLEAFAPQGFDLHLLGMGPEGHVNSLFPHTAAVAETSRAVVAVTDSPKPPARRGTLTLAAVARAERVWLLVSGAAKAEAAAAVAAGADAAAWPAAGARGAAETLLFVDEAAASQLR